MNRKIKFRVWDLTVNKWIENPIDIYDNTFGNYGDEVVYQQFIGLKDKNGKEIYEGDFLSVKSYDGWDDRTGFYYRAIVFYDETSAAFRHSFNPKIGGHLFTKDSITNELEMEVIGNIFENSELLQNLDNQR